ncbi:MAG: hypothetical protein R2774_02940 [Saprospiraceae bacterium]
MKGDIILLKPEYYSIAAELSSWLSQYLMTMQKFVIVVAGESGSGKSVTAITLSQELENIGIRSTVLHMDDYFKLPPISNNLNRMQSLENVGLSEVRLDVLQSNIDDFIIGKISFVKPLVDYNNNSISEEEIDVGHCQVLIVEGTYTAALENVHLIVFLERTFLETLENRRIRNRESHSEFIEQVLAIEHKIIVTHKEKSHIIIDKNYQVKYHKHFKATYDD